MQQDVIVSIPAFSLFFPLISVVLLAIGIIVGLDCVWRVQKHLKTFMKLLTTAVVFKVIQEILNLLAPSAQAPLVILNLLSSLFLLVAFVEMYKIVRSLDNENPQK